MLSVLRHSRRFEFAAQENALVEKAARLRATLLPKMQATALRMRFRRISSYVCNLDVAIDEQWICEKNFCIAENYIILLNRICPILCTSGPPRRERSINASNCSSVKRSRNAFASVSSGAFGFDSCEKQPGSPTSFSSTKMMKLSFYCSARFQARSSKLARCHRTLS